MAGRVGLTVLGCGRWGSFHLWYGAGLGLEVTGWEPEWSEPMRELMSDRRNRYVELPPRARLTVDLGEAVSGASAVIVAVPSQSLRELAARLAAHDLSGSDLILCMKGLERETGRRLSEVVTEEGVRPRSLAVWVGPGHPALLAAGQPSCMIVAAERGEDGERMAGMFGSRLIRLYRSCDLTGCEIGAAAKNVVGIAAGMLDGMGLHGLKGALMARAPLETARLTAALGGDWRSIYGLSHLGDYEATLFSPHSRNRLWGECLVTGEPYGDGLAEGVETCAALVSLASSHGVEMPIAEAVRSVIEGAASPSEAVDGLFARPLKEEFRGSSMPDGGAP